MFVVCVCVCDATPTEGKSDGFAAAHDGVFEFVFVLVCVVCSLDGWIEGCRERTFLKVAVTQTELITHRPYPTHFQLG